MQTGYDSYWMYQNNRPGPLHSLQNNNHCSNAVFTDSNRPVQNGRLINHYNNCMPPQNNVAYHHQNSQYRTSDFHQIPSLMYSEPFRPSNVNNTQPRRGSVNWSSRSGYLPHNSYTQQNFNTRCSENYSQFSQVSSETEKNNVRVNTAPDAGSIHPISRIRVKDVYSINNNNVSDPFSQKGFVQPQSKRQRESVINYGSNNYFDFDSQTEFINHSYLGQSKLLPPYYRHAASEQPQQPSPQFGVSRPSIVSSNNTSSFASQEIHPDQYNPDNMLSKACDIEKASENTNSGLLDSVQTYSQATRGVFSTSNSSQIQNCHQSQLEGTANLENLSSSAFGTFGNSNSNEVLANGHEKVPRSDSASLASFNSPKSSRTNLNSQVTSNPETSPHRPRQEETLIKISIPHTGQSSFIRLNDSNSKNHDSNLSLPCLLESNNEYFNTATTDRLSSNKVYERKNSSGLQTTTSEKTRNSPPASLESHQNSGSPHLNNSSLFRKLRSKESLNDVIKESVNNLVSKSVPQKDLISKKVAGPKKNIELNLLNIKQEKSFTSAESHPEEDHSISGNDELGRIITKEKIQVEENNSAQFSENLKTLEKSNPVLKERGNSDFIEVKTFPKISESIPSEKPESKSLENSISKDQTLKKKVHQNISYKSKINRDKLDMLIQFLRKDDEPVQDSSETPCEETTSENNKCKDREKPRLRKLSKTCIVRNKNISREMVSLVSPKASRVDPSKSSSEVSHPVKSNVDSQKEKELKEGSAETCLKYENHIPSSEQQPQKEDSSQLERNIKSELVTGEVQKPNLIYLNEAKDKEMVNMMRILRTMATNFCRNCKLSSSADSFWVNVVSFELRCLNCFEKFFPKEFPIKNYGCDTDKQKVNSENISNCFSECVNSNSKENQQEKSNNLKGEKYPEDSSERRRESSEKSKMKMSIKEGNMTEGKQNSEENESLGITKKKNSWVPNSIREKSQRKSSSSEESANEISRKKSILREQQADNEDKSRSSENECKNEKLLKTPSRKVKDDEDVPKKRKIGTPKRRSSTESTPNKTPMSDKCAKNEGKRLTDLKERSTEQPKIPKQGKPEVPEISFKSKELSSSNESKRKPGSNDSERKSLKRKHSNDDSPPRKVYIPNDHATERKEVVTHSTDKTKSSTKDVNQKSKLGNENENSKSSTNKSKTNDIISQKIKSPDRTHNDSIRSSRKRTPRDNMKQNKAEKRRRHFIGKIPKYSSLGKGMEKQIENLKTIKKERQTERNE